MARTSDRPLPPSLGKKETWGERESKELAGARERGTLKKSRKALEKDGPVPASRKPARGH